MKAALEYCRRVWRDNYVIQLFANADRKRANEESSKARMYANINQRRVTESDNEGHAGSLNKRRIILRRIPSIARKIATIGMCKIY